MAKQKTISAIRLIIIILFFIFLSIIFRNIPITSATNIAPTFMVGEKMHLSLDLNNISGDLVIPDGVTEIPCLYLCGNNAITSVTIPESVEIISSDAFKDSAVEKVKIEGNNLKEIRYGAFNGSALTEFLELPDSVEIIGSHVFTHCHNIQSKSFKIPKKLKLIGDKTSAGMEIYDTKDYNHSCNTTHVFYDIGNIFQEFTGESKKYVAIDGVLYRKNKQGFPNYLISIPPGKTTFDQFDYADEPVEGRYVMPNTVLTAAELAFGNNNKSLHTVVLSNAFRVKRRPNYFQRYNYNMTFPYNYDKTSLEEGKCAANALSYIGGYGNPNFTTYEVRPENRQYRAYKGCVYSKDYKILYAVAPFCREIILHGNTKKIDPGALLNGRGFGSPISPEAQKYNEWLKDTTAKSLYAGVTERFVYTDNFNFDKLCSSKKIGNRIVAHILTTVFVNDNPQYEIVRTQRSCPSSLPSR